MKCFHSIFSIAFLLMCFLICGCYANAQELRIPTVIVQQEDSTARVPVAYLNARDSILGVQLSILYPPEKLRLDSVTFNEGLFADGVITDFGMPTPGDARAIILFGSTEPIRLVGEDSILLTIHFKLLDDFKGIAPIEFNSNFPIRTATLHEEITPTLINGAVVFPGFTSTSSATKTDIVIFPNPTNTRTLHFQGDALPEQPFQVSFFDGLGRAAWSGFVTGARLRLPEGLPAGTYWLVARTPAGRVTRKVVLR